MEGKYEIVQRGKWWYINQEIADSIAEIAGPYPSKEEALSMLARKRLMILNANG